MYDYLQLMAKLMKINKHEHEPFLSELLERAICVMLIRGRLAWTYRSLANKICVWKENRDMPNTD